MKKYYFKINASMFLIYFEMLDNSSLENICSSYVLLDSFIIDYNNKQIKEIDSYNCETGYAYLVTSALLKDEALATFSQHDLYRPTAREPLIRGLYALASRNHKSELSDNILKTLSSEIVAESNESIIQSVFSHKDRK